MMRSAARFLRRLADHLDPTAPNRHVQPRPEYVVVNIDSDQVIRAIKRRNARKGVKTAGI